MDATQFLAWLKTPTGAAAGAGVVGVGGYALYKRRKASGSGSGGGAYTAGTVPTDANGNPITGLAGYPDTLATDIENTVQDQLNQQQDFINSQLSGLKAAPKVGNPPGKPSTNPPPHHYPPGPRGRLGVTQGITAEAVLKPGRNGKLSNQQIAGWAKKVGVSPGAVQVGPKGHVYTYEPRK